MKGKKLEIQFPYKIINIKTNSFSEVNLSEDEIDNFKATDIEFRIKPSFGFNDELHAVKVNYAISYLYNDTEILKIDVDTVFEYINNDNFNSRDRGFLASILGISLSTIRGIILNRTIGSFLNNIYLPIINPTEIIEDQFQE